MSDYEKLGAFYLGKSYDVETDTQRDDLILYDSSDLTTHAVIIGMTGSGKTGLGIALLEEAAIDGIPVIAIDPKGDLGNCLLSFPELAPADFKPWVNPREAATQGMSVQDYAADQARLWEKGLAQWGQGRDRIRRFRDSVEMAIHTPGSNAGIPVSVLKSFDAPPVELRSDLDLYRERIQSTATGILALLGIDADPLTSREHILLANVLQHAWDQGGSLDIAGLIGAIQNPPMDRVGVVDVDSFYPAKERFALAMRLNNLLAAPGFEVWMQGEALDAGRLLHDASGKPRLSIMSIAHLSDSGRMFFVTMLLNEIIGWMRRQSGTGSLRAIIYMDEIFGYMPPTANPPSKLLLLTLLKQARAFGVGLVLATQNPVDLDYKGLSNAGTWFIGRLQTERDKARVMQGLEGASGGEFDRGAMERTLSGLGKRRFLLHNVHETAPVVFSVRWVMSYLAGPLTRDHIKALMDGHVPMPEQPSAPMDVPLPNGVRDAPPVLPPQLSCYYLPVDADGGPGGRLYYDPRIIGAASVHYHSARYQVDERRELVRLAHIDSGPVPVDWGNSEEVDLAVTGLATEGVHGAGHAELPAEAGKPRNYVAWERDFRRWLRTDCPLVLYRSARFRLVSGPRESEGEFRVRLRQAAHEERDVQVGKLRKRYESKSTTLENRLQRARQRVESQKEMASQSKIDTAIGVGTALLGAFLGRKRVSQTTASSVGSAIRKAGRMSKKAGDVSRASELAESVEQEIEDLNRAFESEVEQLEALHDVADEPLEEVLVRAASTSIQVQALGLAWLPVIGDDHGRGHIALAAGSRSSHRKG